MLLYFFLKFAALVLAAAGLVFAVKKKKTAAVGLFVAAAISFFIASRPLPLHFAMPPTLHSYAPGGLPASIPFFNIFKFFWHLNDFQRVENIGADPTAIQARSAEETKSIKLELVAKEVISEVGDGIYFNYWTYNSQVPGPFFRIREGQSVELTLRNDPTSLHSHNIDLHAVTGPGGGAKLTNVAPGESKTFLWKALNPGLYEYHCATPNVSTHNAHGQYGMILVEPRGGLPKVDKEFYVMQGELYTAEGLGKKGLTVFDTDRFLSGDPTYVTFNGRIEKTPRMKARTGEKIRIFVGNGGVNLFSAFHVIGEIFDRVYPEGAIGSAPLRNIQTTTVPPGGSAIVEFTLEVPGTYLLVDHALARMNKGAWMRLEVEGKERPEIFSAVP